MSDKKDDDMIVLYDLRLRYLTRTAVNYGCVFGLIYIGVLLNSDAMQWIGAIIGMLTIIGTARVYSKQLAKTPQEAADYIARKYGVVASEQGRERR